MSTHEKQKHEVALELMEWAIQAFLSGRGYYVAIHLAGAAEEVLAVYLRSPDMPLTPAAESFASLFLHLSEPTSEREADELRKWGMDRMNGARNSVKHKRGHGDNVVEFDPYEEAADAIDRAISNYTRLLQKIQLPVVPSMDSYHLARKTTREQRERNG